MKEDVLYNSDSEADELGKIYTMVGNKPVEVSELFAGDIGAIGKLANTKTGDTLSTATPILYGKTEIPSRIHMRYATKTKETRTRYPRRSRR